jgi:general secretion pathway protein F
MPEFVVRVIHLQGGTAESRVQAEDAQAVASVLGVPASAILSVNPASPRRPGITLARRDRFPRRLFSHELAVLLRAGIPLLEALTTLREKETSSPIAGTLEALIVHLRRGEALSEALRTQPQAFDELFIAVVASAERTGQLEQALNAHAQYLAWVEELRAKLVAAAVYPLLLVGASVAVLLFLLVFVVPRFAGLLDGAGTDIAPASRALIDLGRVTGEHPWLTIAAGALLLALPFFASRLPAVRAAVSAASWHLPSLGDRLRLLALARLYRTMSMLLRAGVPVLSALRTSRQAVAVPLRAPLDAAIDAVNRGERLSTAFEQQQLATPVALRMVRVGERSGRVGDMLGEAASFHDEELTRLSELVTRLVNPVLMLVMGGVIGTVVVLLYLPIFQLVEQVQ